jgi:trigger factor
MQVKITNLTDTKFKLHISADEPLMVRLKEHTLSHLGVKYVKLPGFRNGKAPLSLVEKNVDPALLQQEFLEEAVNHLYKTAVNTEKIRPVTEPQVSIKKFVPFTTLEIEAEVEAVGPITLPNYKNIKLEKPKISVTAKDISGVLDSLRQRQAERVESTKPAKNGDEVIIDFKGTDSKKQPVIGADGTGYPLVIGSNTFIPGFEPNLVGLKAGQEKTFDVTFPKDYGVKALQNKKVTFWVKVNKASEIKSPKLDDTFAAKVGPFKSLDELKVDIRKQLTLEAQQQADREYENKLITQIASKAKVAVPDALIDDQVAAAEQSEKQNLAYRGQTWQEHLKEEGVTEEEHRKRNRPEAEANVKAGLVLTEIANQEGLNVTQEELDVRIKILKNQYQDPAMQAELDKPENQRDIANRILTEKTLTKLKSYAAK